MTCERTPFTCPGSTEFWADDDAFKKSVIELLSGIAGGGGGGGAGHVIVDSGNICVDCPLPAGDNNIGNVDVVTLPAITGTVSVSNFPATQPVSGTVDIGTMPAISGTVAVSSLPAITGAVTVSGTVGLTTETTIADGRKTVTNAGTREALVGVSTPAKRVDIQALSTNTAIVVVGAVTCVAAAGSRRGIGLTAGQTYSFSLADLANIYVDAVVSGEGVNFVYIS